MTLPAPGVRRAVSRRGLAVALTALSAALVALLAWREDWLAAALAASVVLLATRAVPGGTGEGAAPTSSQTPRAEDGLDFLLVSPDPIVAVDRRAVVTAANEASRRLIPGLRIGEPLAFSLRAPEVLDAIRAVGATGEPRDVEYGGRTGSDPLVAVRLRALGGGPDKRKPAVALFFTDRTREHRVEAMRVDFIATVSHELRTPLASISGFIDTLAGPARDDTAARDRFLAIMREQANRMTRLVDDLLRLSKVELHEHVAPTEPVELRGLVAHMIEILVPLARERQVAIAYDAPAGPVIVAGDRDELLRVIENLIENAVKYGGPGRVDVTLRSPEDGRTVELAVADHGPGIAAEHLPRLTERFYRVDPVESRSRGGTGLGLAIVKHVVGRHRGRLAIESAPGRGTTVRVHLPALAQ